MSEALLRELIRDAIVRTYNATHPGFILPDDVAMHCLHWKGKTLPRLDHDELKGAFLRLYGPSAS